MADDDALAEAIADDEGMAEALTIADEDGIADGSMTTASSGE